MIDIKVPPLGDSITEATIARWAKNEGDAVAVGETLVELETDKINVEVPAERAGVLAKQGKKEGDIVGVGEVLGAIDDASRADDKRSGGGTATKASGRASSRTPAAAAPVPADPAPAAAAAAQRVAPSAARYAEEKGLSLESVSGTGRGGMISKADVIEQQAEKRVATPPAPMAEPEQAIAPAAPAPRLPAPGASRETREKMSTRRKRIAENLLASKQNTADLTTFNEVDMTAVIALRERHKERVEKEHDVKLSFMPFFARAAVLALEKFPMVNAQVDGDTIIYKHYVNLGIAVASEQGLVVPNVKDAHEKGMLDIGREIAALAKRARNIKLTMDDLTGGTFTITNGGVFGSLVSTPIINYPQVAILGLHKIQDRVMVIDGKMEIRPMMYVALSYDHRIIDGQQAVLFLVKIKELMEDPAAMLF